MGRTAMKWLLALIITGAIGIGIWFQFSQDAPKDTEQRPRNLPRNILNIGENENVELLKKLNAEWTMPETYAHEVFEVDGITMEWVQARGDKPDKAVLQLHGADDPFVKAEEVVAFVEGMRRAKTDWHMVVYGNAVHAFTNPDADTAGIPGVAYNELAAERAWGHMQDFFAEIFTPN